MNQGFNEARIQTKIRQMASRTVVLAVSGKFGKASLEDLCP